MYFVVAEEKVVIYLQFQDPILITSGLDGPSIRRLSNAALQRRKTILHTSYDQHGTRDLIPPWKLSFEGHSRFDRRAFR
jgi:hypothetical protein